MVDTLLRVESNPLPQIFGILGGWNKQDTVPTGIVKAGAATLAEFSWKTDQAVSPEYLKRAKEILTKVPKERRQFETSPLAIKHDEWQAKQEEDDQKVDHYVSPYLDKYQPTEHAGTPTFNPFDTFMPRELENLDVWLREQKRDWEYKSGSSRRWDREHGRFPDTMKEMRSREWEDRFIRVVRAWNEYHVGFLEALNIADPAQRAKQVEALGKEIFEKKPMGFLSASNQSVAEMSPYDNPQQWMVYHALNVLISPESGITPIARFRAIEVLSQFPSDEITQAFFGLEIGKKDYNSGRSSPDFGFTHNFKEKLLRLPRSFWDSPAERTQTTHKDWLSNSKILKLFGVTDVRKIWWNEGVEQFGVVVNRLVEQYPAEAIHLLLLMMVEGKYDHSAFQAIVKFSKLDPITVQKLFGGRASYLRLHQMPKDTDEQIGEALGVQVFDEDFAEEFKDLPPDRLLQVIRRLQVTNTDLDRQLADRMANQTRQFFAGMKEADAKKIDPKGYWQLLGVHPHSDPKDLDDDLKRAYRARAKKYHPDGEQPDEEKMKDIIEAYEVLSDQEKRKKYSGI
jgi:hypothetical protein